MDTKEAYKVSQAQWVKDRNVKVGDKVKATRHFHTGELGFDNSGSGRIPYKTRFVDNKAVGVIRGISDWQITVDCDLGYAGTWGFPYFALEIVEQVKEKEKESKMSIEAKLEQVKKDLAANNRYQSGLQADIDRLEKEIKDAKEPEPTYSIGDRFKYDDEKYMIVIQMQGENQVALVGLNDGCLFCGSDEVQDTNRITKAELACFAPDVKTRYWDSQKKERVGKSKSSAGS